LVGKVKEKMKFSVERGKRGGLDKNIEIPFFILP